MNKSWILSMALLFSMGISTAYAQDRIPPPDQEQEDDELTPAQAMELLKEAHELMQKAEELLNDSSRGKALETEKDLLAKLEREFKDIPAGDILKKVGRVVEKAEKREKDSIEKLNDIIKKAKSSSGSSPQKSEQQKPGDPKSAQQPGSAASKPYDPNRTDDVSKFRSKADKTGSWGNLPPAARAATLDSAKSEIPPEFMQEWSEYSKKLAGDKK